MKIKKILTLALSIVLFSTTALGCNSSDNNGKKETDVAMGRYVEKPVNMPEAVQSGEEMFRLMVKNSDGLIEIYCHPTDWEKGGKYTQYTLNKDNSWVKSVPEWLNQKGMYLGNIAYAPDGTKYAMMTSSNTDTTPEYIKFYESKNNHTAKEIFMEDYKDKVGQDKEPSRQMSVLADHSILLSFYTGGSDVCSGKYSVYKNGKLAYSFKMGSDKYAISDNNLFTINENCDQGTVIDLTTGKAIYSVPISGFNYRNQFIADKDGNWYFLNLTGIQRLIKGGNTWETILNGAQASMSKDSMFINSVFFGSGDDFYVVYSDEMSNERYLKHYLYDKTIPSTPSIQLIVSGLNWNETIRESLSDFNQAHPEAQVEYRQLGAGDTSVTNEDLIKTLNTELLSGKGPDILVLDGLPANSYVEKNILADISKTITPLVENGELLPNIMKDITDKDGRIYSIPIRFNTYFAYGDKTAVHAAASIDTLADYAKTAKLPLFGSKVLSYTDLSTLLYECYAGSLLKENGFNRDILIDFLTQLKLISDQTTAIPEESKETEDSIIRDYQNRTFCRLIDEKKALLGIHELNCMYQTYNPIVLTDKIGGTYSAITGTFTPMEVVGVNNAGAHKDLACEFIKTLLSKSIQKTELVGFPVNAQALKIFGMNDRYALGWHEQRELTRLGKEKLLSIDKMLEELTTPFIIDWNIHDLVISKLVSFLSGKTSLDETADQIIDETNSYFSLHNKE